LFVATLTINVEILHYYLSLVNTIHFSHEIYFTEILSHYPIYYFVGGNNLVNNGAHNAFEYLTI